MESVVATVNDSQTAAMGEATMEDTHSLNDSESPKNYGSRVDSKVCGVCGDRALGNNFNAITCESCKAFFRRNALKTKEFVCPFTGNCKVDPVTRRFCQKCRLKKCFDIGMKKEWIMTDEEKKMKKIKIEQNRSKRHSVTAVNDVSETSAAKIMCTSAESSKSPLPDSFQTLSAGNSSEGYDVEDQLVKPKIEAKADSEVISNTGPPTTVSGYLRGVSSSTELNSKQMLANPSVTAASALSSKLSSVVEGSYSDSMKTTDNPIEPASARSVKTRDFGFGSFSQNRNDAQMPLLSSLIRTQGKESLQEPSGVSALSPSTAESNESMHMAALAESASVVRMEYNQESTAYPIEAYPSGVGEDTLAKIQGFHQVSGAAYTSNSHPHLPDGYSEPRVTDPFVDSNNEVRPLPHNTMDSILSVAIKAEFQDFQIFSETTHDTSMSATSSMSNRVLNKAEQKRLNELLLASHALNAPVDAEGPVKVSDPSLINVINLTDIAIRRLIKMSKKITGFKSMCQEDQIALLKGGCTEMMILRSVVSYDPDRDSWNIPHSELGYNIKLGVLKEARGNLYEEHQRFVKSFKSEWRTDENVMMLLCAITLFTAERPNVIHKDVVKYEQDCYYYLLKRYLESYLGGCEARSTYLELIKRIAELRVLNSNHLRVFLEVNPREVEPLLIEIFDLK